MRRSSKSSKGKGKAPAARAVPRKPRVATPPRPPRAGDRVAEALAQQAATSAILRVIRHSSTDAQPVFDLIAERAMELCGALHGGVLRFDGQLIHVDAHVAVSPAFSDALRRTYPMPPGWSTAAGRAILTGTTVHIPDVERDPEYEFGKTARAAGFRSALAVPMLRDGAAIGAIVVFRGEAAPFSERHVALLQTFAEQAVIAIENVRLFTELEARNHALTEALDQQTATGEILRVISSSPTDIQPVFDIIAESAVRLCGAEVSTVTRFDGEWVHLAAVHGSNAEGVEALRRAFPMRPGAAGGAARAVQERALVHIPDVLEDPGYRIQEAALAAGFRALLGVPMLRDGRAIGAITVGRAAPGRYRDSQIQLLQTFAEQAIIAIENVRLFTALEDRNTQLGEALEQQTATAEILRAISSSPTDIRPVLETVVHAAARFCGAPDVAILRLDGAVLRGAATVGPFGRELASRSGGIEALELPVTTGSVTGRAVLECRTVHVHDLAAEPEDQLPVGRELQRRFGHHTILAAPLLREGVPLGAIALFRTEVKPFSDKQIGLLRIFADQAAIAIENVRLFGELQSRNRDLTETLEQQTATSEILRVISGSPTDVQPVFDTIVQSVVALCDTTMSSLFVFDGELIHFVGQHNFPAEALDVYRRTYPLPPAKDKLLGRALLEGQPVNVADVSKEFRSPIGQLELGNRSVLAVPMLRDGRAIGVIATARAATGLFPDKQVDLLKTFADQAVIAIENVRLFTEVQDRNRALTESLEQQTATSEILRIISTSPTDLQPVLDAVAENAAKLCAAIDAQILRVEGRSLRLVASFGPIPLYQGTREISRDWVSGRAVVDRRTIHVHDLAAESESEYPVGKDFQRQTGHRTTLATPLLREGVALGVILIRRMEVHPFSDKQVRLLETFADQAAIAIENVRLFQELERRNRALTESLEQQTATGEILRVISGSPTDVRPVFETIARNARALCTSDSAIVFTYDRGLIHMECADNANPEQVAALREAYPMPANSGSATGRALLSGRTTHIPDVREDPDYTLDSLRDDVALRTLLAVPMIREGTPIGTITVQRWGTPRPFADGQIALLQTFADQAVIAIENVRLFKELEARNRDLSDTLEQQTATGEVLRVISRSPTDVQPVFDVLAENAARLCESFDAGIWRRDGDRLLLVAHHGPIPIGQVGAFSLPLVRGTAAGRAVLDAQPVHVADMQMETSEFPESSENARQMGFRTILCVPLMREGTAIGTINLRRTEIHPFTERHVSLLQTFADQAVIAIENVRLFTEVQERNRALTESLEQQTATSDILRAISSSPTDVQPVFDIIGERAEQLCDAAISMVSRFDGELIHLVSLHGVTGPGAAVVWEAFPQRPDEETLSARAVRSRAVAHVADVLTDPLYAQKETARASGYRASLAVPMIREDHVIGVIFVARTRPGPFTDNQVELLKTFADQAVIAVENVRLFTELGERNRDLTDALAQQTATSEVLKVISRSTFDLRPVLETLIENASRLCHADGGVIYKADGDLQRLAASYNISRELREFIVQNPLRPSSGTAVGRAMLESRVIHIHDVLADPGYTYGGAGLGGYRTILGVPMLREGVPIGVFSVWRREVRPFTDKQIELITTFADQGAIAIENVRLFQELENRTRDLTRSVDELRALNEVSQAVGSTLDLETVLATIVSRAVQLSGSHEGLAYEFDEPTQSFHMRAAHQVGPELLETLRAAPIALGEGAIGRAGVSRQPVEVADIAEDRQLVAPRARGPLLREGMRSLLAVPLVREDRLLGALAIGRREQGSFSPEVVAMLQTFATQSVLAIHNARLFREVQQQKHYSEALVHASPVAIATLDFDGRVVGWNPGAERLFGYTETEAIGRRLEDLVATPELREEVRAGLQEGLRGERRRMITRRVRKDGTLVDVELSAMPVVVGGAAVGVLAMYHDITDLLRARREAEAANEAKSAFLATMSHEIRTPMNAVIGMSGLLLNTALGDEQREYAEVIRQSGDALLTVINDILDFSKIEAGRLELESQPFDLRECVEGALDLVATRAAEKGIDLAYLIGDGTPAAITGDVTRLRQILLNLLSNAVKFTERGEVVLAVTARPLPDAAPVHELTFSVRDTGIGIPPDRLGRLFQSFSQVDASTTRRYGGTGLGLAISQRLTELMGGRIEVASEVGRGSEFHFTIRARAAEAPALPPRRDLSGVQPSLRGKRVLVVDDNATNRRILTTHLDNWGMPARATESPREALGWIRAGEAFDIGILDMHMPEMDGVTLARALREHPAGATLPLILFTSLGRREALGGDTESFAGYLHKPIKPSQLFDALVSVLAEQPVHVAPRATARIELDPDLARRHPLRILLAEDNVVNQKLALRLLGQMGYRADLAGNGLEAVDAVARQTYDLVLMDVQMPEMDGLEASREINRRWPGSRPRIVAMTANAMRGDRELCEAAGMDDYVAKPIRVEELVAALERCRPPREASGRAAPGAGPGAASAPADGEIDRATLDRLVEAMGAAFVAELIDTFGQDARELIAALRRALVETDLDAFRRAAHSLKSTAESLGATRLAALARELEAAARAGSLEGAGDRVQALAHRYDLVTRVLGELRRGLPS